MRHFRVVAVFHLFAALIVTSAALAQQSNTSEEDTIRSLMLATTAAFNDHDAKAWAQFCMPEARLVTVRGESMQGAAEIEKGLAEICRTRARNALLSTLDVSVRFLRPDVALAHVTNEMSGLVDPNGEALPSHRELSVCVLE